MSDDLTDAELAALAGLLGDSAAHEHCCGYPASWCRWFASRAEELRGQLAQRVIERAIRDDPCAFYWYGRLG